MIQGSNVLAFYVMVLGNTLGAHTDFIERLKKRLQLCEVNSEEDCEVIIAFVPIASRAETDIKAALQKIQTSRPVVLAVFHHTFDENYIAPESQWSVERQGLFAVNLLFYEDDGLLRSVQNDKALKSITDYLITLGASPNILIGLEQLAKKTPDPPKRCRQCCCWKIAIPIVAGCCLGLAAFILVLENCNYAAT